MLKTLDAHNKERADMFNEVMRVGETFNGIACPKCLAHLKDSTAGHLLLSWPPKKAIYCPKCGFSGFRIA